MSESAQACHIFWESREVITIEIEILERDKISDLSWDTREGVVREYEEPEEAEISYFCGYK